MWFANLLMEWNRRIKQESMQQLYFGDTEKEDFEDISAGILTH